MKPSRLISLIIIILILSSCTPPRVSSTQAPTAAPAITILPYATKIPTAVKTATAMPIPFPAVTLKPGNFYFSVDGATRFVFSRNVAGYQESHYTTLIGWSASAGSTFVRIQVDSMGMGYTKAGAVDEGWAAQWDRIFTNAEDAGIYVLPVFSAWYDWNAGAGYSTWKSNPLNAENGGPVKNPGELFQKDSATQQLWLDWLKALVQRWQGRKNILAWEIFSEVNIAGSPTEATGIEFVNRAVEVIHAADLQRRPITASLAETGLWNSFYRKSNIDFIQIHPYPVNAQLDRAILTMIRQALAAYNKPVLIGESGLSAATPDTDAGKLTIADHASIGVRHAIWAGIVSGAMNGRSLWWEDGVGIAFPSLGMPYLQKYANTELPAVLFVKGIDFSGFKPVIATNSSGIWGAVVGDEEMMIGWYRDVSCEPPNWNLKPEISGQTVTISLPKAGDTWQIDFYDTQTGTTVLGSITVNRQGSAALVALLDFKDDIAFKMKVVK